MCSSDLQYFVQITVAETGVEAATIDVSDVIVENGIFQAGSDVVVFPQIDALNAVTEVSGIIVVPLSVLRDSIFGDQIDMSIPQFVRHIA